MLLVGELPAVGRVVDGDALVMVNNDGLEIRELCLCFRFCCGVLAWCVSKL